MTESEDLELYYIVKFKTDGMPKYSELSQRDRIQISQTLDFKLWRVSESGKKLIQSVSDYIKGK